MPTEFLDKSGKKFPFMGSPDEFNKWNKFGFTLVQQTPDSESVGGIIPKPSQLGAQQAPQSPITKFNMAILDMLKSAQGKSGNEDLYKQQIGLQRAAIERKKEITPEGLRQLNPSQQSAIRSGDIGALEPEIDAVAAKIKANDSRLRNFESILGQMKSIGQDVAKLSPSPDVMEGYLNMMRMGGNITSVPMEIRNNVISKMTEEDWDMWTSANAGQQTPITTNDYKNWSLAGGLKGTGQSYGDWLDRKSGGVEITYEQGEQFVTDNPNASEEELKSELLKRGVSPGDANAIIAAREGSITNPEETASQMIDTVKKLKDTGFSRSEAEDYVISEAKGTDDKELPDYYMNAIKDALVEVYGRTFWQRRLPGGR